MMANTLFITQILLFIKPNKSTESLFYLIELLRIYRNPVKYLTVSYSEAMDNTDT